MKVWRIHVGWAIVTLLAMVLTARIASRRDVGDAPPAAGLRNLQTPVPLPSNSGSRPSERPSSEAARPSRSPASVPDPTLPDKIRAMMKNPQDREELERMVNSIQDRHVMLGLLKEGLFADNVNSCHTAINLLSGMKGRDVAGLLESFLKTHPDKDQAANAACALGEVGDPASMQVLMDTLQSRNPQVRLWCAESLLGMGYSAPADDLIAEMDRQFESPDGAIRKKAIDTVSQFNRSGVLPLLTRALRDSNGDVRTAALIGFGNLRNPEYIPLLQPLLDDPIPEVAQQAKDYIEYLKNP
jgi:hypothetical protein